MAEEPPGLPEEMTPGLPSELPSFHDWLSQWLGFNVPVLHLPQTLKNFDKAAGRFVGAVGENWASRLDRGTVLRQARTKADVELIASAGELAAQDVRSGRGTFEQRAIAHAFGEEFLKQSNREKIFRIAVEQISSDAAGATDAAEEISDDWLNEFSSAASNKSEADIQILWGKILAGKIRQPKTFSVHSLRLLANFSADDAQLVHKMLGRTIMGNCIVGQSEGEGIRSDMLVCEELGVLTGAADTLGTILDFPSGLNRVEGTTGDFLINSAERRSVRFGVYSLTRFGRDLLRLSTEYQVPQTYIDHVIRCLKGESADNVTFIPRG